MPASFVIRGPFKVPLDQTVKSKWIKNGCPEFWATLAGQKYAQECGCYVFAMRASKGFRPIYVGRATKSFKQECFASHKISNHWHCPFEIRKGDACNYSGRTSTNERDSEPESDCEG